MGESATIACQPQELTTYATRHSNDFCTTQIPKAKQLIWHIITINDEKAAICFNVKEHHTYKEDTMRFTNIKDGTITEYQTYRNLYIADVKHATSYFIVRVEAYQ